MKVLVTGAAGFLGRRAVAVLTERGHAVTALRRPGGARRTGTEDLDALPIDAGSIEARELAAEADVILHLAGMPDPGRSRADPAVAVRENVGTTVSLLEGCLAGGGGLIYPSSTRAVHEPPPDVYALSKRLGEEACRLHSARAAVVRLPSVFGPGQVRWEGATGAIAAFAARALEGLPIVIPGDPRRTRDFLYVDDVVLALEEIARAERWGEPVVLSSGRATPLEDAARLVRAAADSASPIETPGGELPAGENESYGNPSETGAGLVLPARSLDEGVRLYVDWLRRHPAAQGRAQA